MKVDMLSKQTKQGIKIRNNLVNHHSIINLPIFILTVLHKANYSVAQGLLYSVFSLNTRSCWGSTGTTIIFFSQNSEKEEEHFSKIFNGYSSLLQLLFFFTLSVALRIHHLHPSRGLRFFYSYKKKENSYLSFYAKLYPVIGIEFGVLESCHYYQVDSGLEWWRLLKIISFRQKCLKPFHFLQVIYTR